MKEENKRYCGKGKRINRKADMGVFRGRFVIVQLLVWISVSQSAAVTERIVISPRIIGGSDATIEDFPYQVRSFSHANQVFTYFCLYNIC